MDLSIPGQDQQGTEGDSYQKVLTTWMATQGCNGPMKLNCQGSSFIFCKRCEPHSTPPFPLYQKHKKGERARQKVGIDQSKKKTTSTSVSSSFAVSSPSSSCASYPDGSTFAKRLSGMHQGQGIMVLKSIQRAARESSAAVRVCNLVVSEIFRRASSCTSYATFWRSRRIISPGTRTQEKRKKKKRK
ncbi:hypothetical protein BJX62DRAFT_126588 [Aspergillus germanicus]